VNKSSPPVTHIEHVLYVEVIRTWIKREKITDKIIQYVNQTETGLMNRVICKLYIVKYTRYRG